MAFKCLECGHIFEDGEQATWYEHHPYGMGTASEEFSGCPICKGDYEETKQCKICGGEFLEDELNDGVCESCIDDLIIEYKRNFEVCYKIADTEKEEIKINALLVSLLDIEEIEEVLYKYVESKNNKDCSAFINQDRDWFISKLVEEVKK